VLTAFAALFAAAAAASVKSIGVTHAAGPRRALLDGDRGGRGGRGGNGGGRPWDGDNNRPNAYMMVRGKRRWWFGCPMCAPCSA
jgi:hypothetical protein